MFCIGNGQANQSISDKVGALNCMHDQQAVILRGGYESSLEMYFNDYLGKESSVDAGTSNQILCLLFKTYGTKTVVEWAIGILDSLQQTDVLQSRMYESCISTEAENGNGLYGRTLPRKESVIEWVLRDMRKQREHRCSPQRRELLEQQFRKLTTVVQELPLETTSSCKEVFDLWRQGKGIWLLQQALHQIQEVWRSFMRTWKGGENMNEVSNYVVRRLTPL